VRTWQPLRCIDPDQTTITDGVVSEGVFNSILERRVGGGFNARIKL
jgi:hypothetical protein